MKEHADRAPIKLRVKKVLAINNGWLQSALSGWNRVNCTPKFQGYSNLPPSTFPPSPLLLAAEEDPALSMGAEEEESLWTDLVPRIPNTMDRAFWLE